MQSEVIQSRTHSINKRILFSGVNFAVQTRKLKKLVSHIYIAQQHYVFKKIVSLKNIEESIWKWSTLHCPLSNLLLKSLNSHGKHKTFVKREMRKYKMCCLTTFYIGPTCTGLSPREHRINISTDRESD